MSNVGKKAMMLVAISAASILAASGGLAQEITTEVEVRPDLSISLGVIEELSPIQPDTQDPELESMYKQAAEHISNREFNEGATVYLKIIQDYSGPDQDVHRRWSCYTLFKFFWWFKIADENRNTFSGCPPELVARLYGDVDRDPVLMFHTIPKEFSNDRNRPISGQVVLEFDVAESGLVENIAVVDVTLPRSRSAIRFMTEYVESLVYLPKLVDGKAVRVRMRSDNSESAIDLALEPDVRGIAVRP